MKKALFILFFIGNALVTFAQQQTIIEKFKAFYNAQQSDSIFNMFSENVKNALPIDKTRQMVTQLSGQLGKLNSEDIIKQEGSTSFYKAVFDNATIALLLTLDSDNKIAGIFFKPYQSENTTDENDTAASKINIVCTVPDGKLKGILTMPQTNKKVPVVLVIAGSGPTDRNGNSRLGVSGNTYLMLADSLLKYDIACVRYDKRGIGKSTGFKSEDKMSFEDMINDAEGFIKMLKADKRFSEVIILGHSEGSLIGMVAARQAKANAFISVAGAGRSLDKVVAEQLQAQPKDILDESLPILDSLKKGYTVQHVDPKLDALFRPSVQPFLISLFKYDPQTEIKKLHIPVLILQGTTDLQVTVQDAKDLLEADPNATLKLIDGMNHVLKQAPADRKQNMDTYKDPTLPLKPELVTYIRMFISSVNKH